MAAERLMSSRPVVAGFAALGLFWGAWAALLPNVQRATGATKSELGLALLCVAVGAIPGTLLAGRLIDRFGSPVLPLASVAFAAAVTLPGLARSVPTLAAGLVAAGATSGAMDVALNARIAGIEARRGARRMQLAHAFYSAGVVVGAVSAGVARQLGAGREPILLALAALIPAAGLANRRGGPSRTEPAPGPRVTRVLLVLGLVALIGFV